MPNRSGHGGKLGPQVGEHMLSSQTLTIFKNYKIQVRVVQDWDDGLVLRQAGATLTVS